MDRTKPDETTRLIPKAQPRQVARLGQSYIQQGLSIVKQQRKIFILVNSLYFGTVLLGMLIAAIRPEYKASVLASTEDQLAKYGKFVTDAYDSANWLLAAAITWIVNLILGALIITITTYCLPFGGIAFALYRALFWGMLFSPIDETALELLPHYLTLIFEGEAYVLVMLAAWMHGCMVCQPAKYGFSRWTSGYSAGVNVTKRLYPLIALVLLVAAIYEALEVIYLMPKK